MIYLLLSIACSTFIFVLFSWFGKYKVDNLQAIVANYFIAGALGWLPLGGSVESPESLSDWSYWPLLIGILFITLFQLMAKITQDYGVNVVSVTVKMSFIIPAIFGIFLHQESITTIHVIGIVLGLGAVYFINKPESTSTLSWKLPLVLFLGSGLLDTVMKISEKNVVLPEHVATYTSTSFAIAGALGVLYFMYLVFIKKSKSWDTKSWIWGIALGIPNYGSIYFLLKALNGELPSALLYPINNVGIVAMSALIAWLGFRESFTKWKLWGLLLAGLTILLLTYNS